MVEILKIRVFDRKVSHFFSLGYDGISARLHFKTRHRRKQANENSRVVAQPAYYLLHTVHTDSYGTHTSIRLNITQSICHCHSLLLDDPVALFLHQTSSLSSIADDNSQRVKGPRLLLSVKASPTV